MSAPLVLAAGCELLDQQVTTAGAAEELRAEIVDRGGCRWVDVPLEAGVTLADHRAVERRGDGTRVKLDDQRWEISDRSLSGAASARLHLPDLLGGDRVVLEITRERVAEAPPRTLPAGDVRTDEHLTLVVPDGDPQIALYPGGGSSVRVERFLVVPPSEEDRAWPLDAPPEVAVRLQTEPTGAAELVSDPTRQWLRVAASDAPARITVSWEQPDAPTFGERGPYLGDLVVSVDHGEIVWDGDAWVLTQVNGRAVLPDRGALVRALDRRFRYAAMPEPGAPVELRGRAPDWDLAADLRPTLAERAPVGAWPSDPLFPRRLHKARKSGALTPLEATLTVWLYATQLKLDATWALVRPAPEGPGHPASPAGFVRPLVRVTVDGESRWIDPSCTVCAPFEVHPDLEDADALGPQVEHTGPVTPGVLRVSLDGERVAWHAEGPPALLARLRLQSLPDDQRGRALAALVAGAGATLVSVEGLENAGEPIDVVARRGTGPVPDPTTLPTPGADGSAWLSWVGVRELIGANAEPTGEREVAAATLARRDEDGRSVVTLTVRDRLIPPDQRAELDAPWLAEESPAEEPLSRPGDAPAQP
ncbi:MAG: hypothetical protein H6738_15620 [Alphaproteobacteria bacterium]|nr:hypothetical protein [Alphaproteobacteria bacterium]MCB9698207.1 hypothetical protein [Alphaproteobacteria bacterium]